MRQILALAAALLLGAAAYGAPARAPDVGALGWMSGTWVVEKDGRWTEERWSQPRGGVMLGTGLSGKGDRATSFEYMRIAQDAAGKISFWGSPGGKAAVAFPLVSASANEVAFENPAHDFPTRIHYRRSGDRLVATVSGPGGRGAQSWDYRRK